VTTPGKGAFVANEEAKEVECLEVEVASEVTVGEVVGGDNTERKGHTVQRGYPKYERKRFSISPP